eukprot:gene8336-9906_t
MGAEAELDGQVERTRRLAEEAGPPPEACVVGDAGARLVPAPVTEALMEMGMYDETTEDAGNQRGYIRGVPQMNAFREVVDAGGVPMPSAEVPLEGIK